MAKKAKPKRKNNGFTIPIAVVAGFLPGVTRSIMHLQASGWNGFTNEISRIYLGYDWQTGRWIPQLMWYGLAPIVIGQLVHWVASRMGINRALGRARIPVVRI